MNFRTAMGLVKGNNAYTEMLLILVVIDAARKTMSFYVNE